jgi:hypothetical protein
MASSHAWDSRFDQPTYRLRLEILSMQCLPNSMGQAGPANFRAAVREARAEFRNFRARFFQANSPTVVTTSPDVLTIPLGA